MMNFFFNCMYPINILYVSVSPHQSARRRVDPHPIRVPRTARQTTQRTPGLVLVGRRLQ